jgi:FkbM family methyltransferase
VFKTVAHRLLEVLRIGHGLALQFFADLPALGAQAACVILIVELTTRRPLSYLFPPSKRLLKLRLRGYTKPLYFRHWSSDLSVIRQVFCHQEYLCVRDLKDVLYIIDAGANIGCTAFYLLHHYPNAMVVAIEPDRQNFELCSQNLAPFAQRVHLLNKGVWSQAENLRVVPGTNGIGEWAIEVRPCRPDEPIDVEAIGMPELLATSPTGHIDLLKVDIEGAEKEVFGANCTWLSGVRNIVIELHGEACERTFLNALGDYDYDASHQGELLVCSNLRPRFPIHV